MRAALVTGASRGVGRGVAISLVEAGYRVFATGRSIAAASLPDGVVRIRCDHTNTDDTNAAFQRIESESESLDLLVNCAWGGYERMIEEDVFTWPLPFWQQPAHRWESMMDGGVRAAFECSARAAAWMIRQRAGLIVNISYWAAQKHLGNVLYGMAKAATDKMTSDMAYELRECGVTAVSLYPGLVRTEAVMSAAGNGWLDISNSESPEYLGRVIAALDADPRRMDRSGKVSIAARLGAEYGLTDIDGRCPMPLDLESA